MARYGACLRFGYTPAEAGAISLGDLRELNRYADWVESARKDLS